MDVETSSTAARAYLADLRGGDPPQYAAAPAPAPAPAITLLPVPAPQARGRASFLDRVAEAAFDVVVWALVDRGDGYGGE